MKRQPGLLFISIRRWYKMYKVERKIKGKGKSQRGGEQKRKEEKKKRGNN
jgi:hypothetical protein